MYRNKRGMYQKKGHLRRNKGKYGLAATAAAGASLFTGRVGRGIQGASKFLKGRGWVKSGQRLGRGGDWLRQTRGKAGSQLRSLFERLRKSRGQ